MPGDIVIPPTLAEDLAELTRLDREVLGAMIVTDRYEDLGRNEGVAGYINLEVGEPGEVTGTEEADEILNEFSEEGLTEHRYFHTHPLGGYVMDGANLEGVSEADVETWTENRNFHDDEDWWHMIAYNSDKPGKKLGTNIITDSDWGIQYSGWSHEGEEWHEIGTEAYDELMDQGLEEVDPYEHARKVA